MLRQIDEEQLMGGDRDLIPKHLLKKIAEDKFSKLFAFRPKQGFGIPTKLF